MATKSWEWPGSSWWKFDFHTHTPASADYSDKDTEAKDWLLDFMRAGVDCVAVTDHNTGSWIDRLKQALQEIKDEKHTDFRRLYLFPGVEITAHGGIHILAILDKDKNTEDITSLLGAVGFNGNYGECEKCTTITPTEVVDGITNRGGLAIPAHVDSNNGLFNHDIDKETGNPRFYYSGTTLDQILDNKHIIAAEVIDPSSKKPQQYINKKLSWTEVLGSDCHGLSGGTNPQEPGSRYTWVKMGEPSIEGLRLALLDGPLSVRRSDQETDDPNKHAPLSLESIEVTEARYMGRSQPFVVGFNPWLNTINGGRGTGKSTIVELLRIALRRDEELPKELKTDFEKYGKAYKNRGDTGLLTDEASIKVIYRKDDTQFRIQWNHAGDLVPIEQENNGEWRPTEGSIQQRFPVRIYSQKQIFQLAKTPLALLRVVDEALGAKYRSLTEEMKEIEDRFLSKRARVREREPGPEEESKLRGELEDVIRRLAIFEESDHAEILKAYQKRTRQQREVEAWEKGWVVTGETLRKVAGDIVPEYLDESAFDPDLPEDSELHEMAAGVQTKLDEIRKGVETLASQVDQLVTNWRKKKETSSWKKEVDAADRTYNELRDRLEKEGVGGSTAYGELVQRRQLIEQRLKELSGRKTEVEELIKQADIQLQKLLEKRQELTKLRQGFLDRVLSENQYVQIHVDPYGAKETVETEFRRLLQREEGGFDKDIWSHNPDDDNKGLLGTLYHNGYDSKEIEHNLLTIKDKVKKIASGQADEVEIVDKRFESFIRGLPPETIDRLDLWFPEDSLDVQYSTTSDGQEFRAIREASPGQKTAALLAFLLSYGEEPLIIDQPEDDLDNRLIYNLIVRHLREVKCNRQVIVVTHNANIVVNGDAENVIVLDVKRGQTEIVAQGGLQEPSIKKQICDVMEGGEEAFEKRYKRIHSS